MPKRQKNLIPAKDMAVIKKVSTSLDADIILYSGRIAYPWDCAFVNKLRDLKRRKKNVLLVLTTGGGSADAAYRMMRLLHHYYPNGKVRVLIIDHCKSAGTLMVIGADEIIMADDAELGPIDVQILKPDEVFEYTSGLTAYQALTALRNETYQSFEDHFLRLRGRYQVSTRTCADIAAKLATGGVQKLYEQLNPERIAEHQRAMTIAEHYGTRLNRGNLIKIGDDDEALERLIAGYPDHGFLIDLTEAKTLFKNVRLPGPMELRLCYLLLGWDLTGAIKTKTAQRPRIMVITEEFEASPADKRKGVKNGKVHRKTSKTTATAIANRLSTNGARHA